MGTEKTDTTDSTQKQEEQQSEEQRAAEEQEGEAAFATGFKKVAGETGDPDQKGEQTDDGTTDTTSSSSAPEKSDAEKQAEEKARQDAEAKAEEQREYDALPKVLKDKLATLENLPGRLNNIEGHIGGLKNATTRIEKALTAAKDAATTAGGAAAAPSDAQVSAALKDPRAWEKLKEDFPDWAGPVEAELTAMRQEIEQAKGSKIDVKALAAEVAGQVRAELVNETVEDAHPKWRKTVKTPEFGGWLEKQPADVKALAASSRPKDAIKLLDDYKAHQDAAAKAAQKQTDKTRRLERAASPSGAGAAVDTGISDEQAFTRGFKRVAGQKA